MMYHTLKIWNDDVVSWENMLFILWTLKPRYTAKNKINNLNFLKVIVC